MPVKITVIKGKCQGGFHEKGRCFMVDWLTPDGMCMGAWDSISPYVTTLLAGGRFGWESDDGVLEIHCPDPKGIMLELRLVKEKTNNSLGG